jgi:hypothetical protein
VIGGDIGAGERGIVQVPLHLLAGQDVRGGVVAKAMRTIGDRTRAVDTPRTTAYRHLPRGT